MQQREREREKRGEWVSERKERKKSELEQREFRLTDAPGFKILMNKPEKTLVP